MTKRLRDYQEILHDYWKLVWLLKRFRHMKTSASNKRRSLDSSCIPPASPMFANGNLSIPCLQKKISGLDTEKIGTSLKDFLTTKKVAGVT